MTSEKWAQKFRIDNASVAPVMCSVNFMPHVRGQEQILITKCVSATWPFQCYCLTTGSMVNKRKRKGGNLASGNRSNISQNIDKGLTLMELTQPTLDDEHKAQVWNLFKCRLAPHVMVSPGVRESKNVLDSGFHVMDSGFFVSGTWIPDSKH